VADKTLMSVSHPAPVRARRLAPRALAVLALLGATLGAAANPPQIKPMRMGSGAETRAVRVDMTAAEPGAARPASAADGAAVAQPTAGVDPLEGLRQRLAGKLSRQTLRDEAANPYDLKVVARTQPAPAAPSARTATRSTRPAAAPPPPVHWAYQGDGGPQAWARLRPEFSLCGKGQRQSPVDIRGGLAVDLEPVQFGYTDTQFAVIDNGHTVQANIAPGSHIEIGGQRFELLNLHFHRPSEERIDGRQFEMSVHLVHRDAQGQLAVVALLIDRGPAHPVVQTVWNNLPLEQGQELAARVPLSLQALLPDDRRYYTYMGSLTTPPCTEGVRWVVMRQPVSMSAEQIELFARIYPMNSRPLQQLAGRRILQSQ
jgi:carbonic anhydrase